MFFRRQKKVRGALVLTSAPTRARPAEESESLAEKYDAQVKWMREKGITGTLSKIEQVEERSVPKSVRKKAVDP
jgi:hypothetical protein